MIEPKYCTLGKLYYERVFRIPQYQRFYSWDKKQREDLFNDIKRLFEQSRQDPDRHHFMATIVCFDTKEVKPIGVQEYRLFEIIDGQQRLTTLIILLKSIHQKLDEGDVKNDIGKILVKTDGHLILLQTNNTNQHLFNSYLREGRIPSSDDIKTHADQKLADAINDCNAFLSYWINSDYELPELLKLIQNRLGFIVYDTNDNRMVYTAFEVLNSRGLAVDWLDKCKNALMGKAFETAPNPTVGAAIINELHQLWGNIYSEISLSPIEGHEVLRFAATLNIGDDGGKPVQAEAAIEKLRTYCVSHEKTTEVSMWLFNIAGKLVVLDKNKYLGPVTKILQARLLAVALMLTDVLNDEERKKALDQWERVTFRIYGLSRKDSRYESGEYVRLAIKVMNKEDGGSCYREIMGSLRELGKEYLIDDSVKIGLENVNCYKDNQEECRYILWRYEEHLAQLAGANAEINKEHRRGIWEARTAAQSIEHIFPQKPKPDGAWEGKLNEGESIEHHVNRIGNLILLPLSINSASKRQSFEIKKETYSKSEGLRMVKEVMGKNDWTQQEIEEREARIVSWAKTAWADFQEGK